SNAIAGAAVVATSVGAVVGAGLTAVVPGTVVGAPLNGGVEVGVTVVGVTVDGAAVVVAPAIVVVVAKGSPVNWAPCSPDSSMSFGLFSAVARLAPATPTTTNAAAPMATVRRAVSEPPPKRSRDHARPSAPRRTGVSM